jgi:DNA-binding transcriptional LysR family regulator
MEGWVRLGLPQDLAESWLPAVLKRFTQAHPKVRAEVQVDRSAELIEKTTQGELDVALVWGIGSDSPRAEHVAKPPIAWIGKPDWLDAQPIGSEHLPLVLFAPPCSFRSAGIAALDKAGIRWRLTCTTPSLSGLWAAVEAGLGITVRTAIGMPKTLSVLDPSKTGLPPLPEVSLILHRAETQPIAAVARLTEIVVETIQLNLVGASPAQ